MFAYNGKKLSTTYSITGGIMEVCYDIAGNLVTENTFSMTVMEYNVGQWYLGNHNNVPADKDEEYYELQNGMIAAEHADIMFLCEYVAQFSKTGRTALSMLSQYFPYVYERESGDVTTGGDCCICSKYPINNYVHHLYHSDSILYYDSCEIIVRGVPITLIITHLHWDNRERRLQEFNRLMTYVSQFPNFILAGDFNTAAKNVNEADYRDMIVPMMERGYQVANANGTLFLPTYHNESDMCLDNIVTSDNMRISDVHVNTTKETDSIDEKIDHMPLIATVTVL